MSVPRIATLAAAAVTRVNHVLETASSPDFFSSLLSPDGDVRMYVTSADLASLEQWNQQDPSFHPATGAVSTVDGDGNTATIIAADATTEAPGIQPGHDAADACADLSMHSQTDWYLPAIDELDILFINQAVIGGFSTSAFPDYLYWSSTEVDSANANAMRFSDGNTQSRGKGDSFSIRCVRK